MSRTLLLNATYEPLCVVPIKRAVCLVLDQKAEVVMEGNEDFRSAHTSMRVPSVIRLTYYVKVPYRSKVPLTKRALIARDKGLCQYCFKPGDEIEHVVPRSRGGKSEWTNVVLACRACNSKKDNKLLSELGWKLKTEPRAPKGQGFLIFGIAKIDESWEPFLGLDQGALATV